MEKKKTTIVDTIRSIKQGEWHDFPFAQYGSIRVIACYCNKMDNRRYSIWSDKEQGIVRVTRMR